MGFLKQIDIEVKNAVAREVADVFAKAAMMDSTETLLREFFYARGWRVWEHGTRWYVEPADDDGYHKNAQSFLTWDLCLAFLLEQVNGFALVDEAGAVVGVGENE